MEIERKFLIKELPKDICQYPFSIIEQCYISINPEIRIRQIISENDGRKQYLAVKSNGDLSRQEYEIEITKEEYYNLKLKIEGNIIHKMRYKYPLFINNKELIVEIDLYFNMDGLQIVEVEFTDEQSAKNFVIPDWFGKEVTYDKKYKNKNLALK